jgi:hypothetical protein
MDLGVANEPTAIWSFSTTKARPEHHKVTDSQDDDFVGALTKNVSDMYQ